MKRLLLSSLLAIASCDGGRPPVDGEGEGEPGGEGEGEGEGEDAVDFLTVLDDVADIEGLRGAGGAVKMMMPVAGAAPRAPLLDDCLFQNTEKHPFHITFLQTLPGGEALDNTQYTQLVLLRSTRVWWGGEILWQPQRPHPISGDAGILAFSLYTENSPGNRLIPDDVRAVFAALTACAPAFAGHLAFAPLAGEQTATAAAAAEELRAEGIAVLE